MRKLTGLPAWEDGSRRRQNAVVCSWPAAANGERPKPPEMCKIADVFTRFLALSITGTTKYIRAFGQTGIPCTNCDAFFVFTHRRWLPFCKRTSDQR